MRHASSGIKRYISPYFFVRFGQSTSASEKRRTNWLIITSWTKVSSFILKLILFCTHRIILITFADEVSFNFPFGSGGNHSSAIPTTTEWKPLVVTVPSTIAQNSRWSPRDLLQLARRHSVHPPIQTSKTCALLLTGEWIHSWLLSRSETRILQKWNVI